LNPLWFPAKSDLIGLDPGFAAEVAHELDISQLGGRADIRDDLRFI